MAQERIAVNVMTLYHGSVQQCPHPVFGFGKTKNDYGRGFYCTTHVELAKEWACAKGCDGFANQYALDTTGLSILRLNSGDYHILNWLAILLQNRTFNLASSISARAKAYILEHFLPTYQHYDIIIGYRADDSYFAYAGDFVDNTLSLESLRTAMQLGKLGEQVVLMSERAFDALSFVAAIPAPSSEYFRRYSARDTTARTDYKRLKDNAMVEDGTYVMDIIRQKWENDDARLF